MKKIFIFGATAAALVCAVVLGIKSHCANNDTLFYANLEALTNPEDDGGSVEYGNGNYNICYSESRVRSGYTYYDCGSCTKIYDEQGRGIYSKCFY